jgi:DNA-binding MarR family transcriptional regulator
VYSRLKLRDHGRIVRGLLARGEAKNDARAVVVRLTDPGTALINRALVIHARVVHETLIDKFSDTDRTALLHTLS